MADQYKPSPGEPYRPLLFPPAKLRSLQPGWDRCGATQYFEGIDPPRTLSPAAAMAPEASPSAPLAPAAVATPSPSPVVASIPGPTLARLFHVPNAAVKALVAASQLSGPPQNNHNVPELPNPQETAQSSQNNPAPSNQINPDPATKQQDGKQTQIPNISDPSKGKCNS